MDATNIPWWHVLHKNYLTFATVCGDIHNMSAEWISSSQQAIDRLGGTRAVAAAFRKVSRSAVANWRSRGFPAAAYGVLGPMLVRRKVAFDRVQLFNMLEPRRADDGTGTGG